MDLSPEEAIGPNSHPISVAKKGNLTATVYGSVDEFTVILTKNGQVLESIVTDDRDEALQIATELVQKRR